MVDYWKHKNLDVFKYAEDNIAGPVDDRQALSDWNRLAISDVESGGKECFYYINGRLLSDIRKEEVGSDNPNDLQFSDISELREFFIRHLFSNVEGAEEQAKLAESACHHFHQSGLQHATNFCLRNLSMNNRRIKVRDPNVRVDFNVSNEGLSITEENTFKQWTEIKGLHTKSHACRGSKEFYAKTKTSYLFTENEIKLVDLTIDCPSKNLAPIFDKRPQEEQITRSVGSGYLRNMVAGLLLWMMRNRAENPAQTEVNPRTIFKQ